MAGKAAGTVTALLVVNAALAGCIGLGGNDSTLGEPDAHFEEDIDDSRAYEVVHRYSLEVPESAARVGTDMGYEFQGELAIEYIPPSQDYGNVHRVIADDGPKGKEANRESLSFTEVTETGTWTIEVTAPPDSTYTVDLWILTESEYERRH